MKRVLCAWFPHWPLQRVRRDRPELDRRPVVIAGRGRRGQEVRLANRLARQAGVFAGQPLAEAETLLEPPAGTRPLHGHPVVLPGDPVADRAALHDLGEQLLRFTPVVGLVEGTAPEALWLVLDGCAPLFGGEEALAQCVQIHCQQLGYHPRVAVAPTPGAAWGLARHATTQHRPLIIPVLPERVLGRLPVAALRLPQPTLELLQELGLVQIDSLRALPRETLPSRFGPLLLRRLDQLTGHAPEEVTPLPSRIPRVQQVDFDEPVADAGWLEPCLAQQLDELLTPLQAGRRGARRVEFRLTCAGGELVEFALGAVRPRPAGRHWHDLLRLSLERQPLPAGVVRVQTEVTADGALETWQESLYGPTQPGQREFETLLEHLASRLGTRGVLHPRPAAELLPEQANGFTPVAEPGADATPRGGASPASQVAGQEGGLAASRELAPEGAPELETGARPLRVWNPPVAIAVPALTPGGWPARFEAGRETHRVIHAWGPERFETDWFAEEPIRRDYHRVVTHTGRQFWLFQDLDQGAWFLQGAFD